MGKVTETIVGAALSAVAVVGSVVGTSDSNLGKAVNDFTGAVQTATEKRDDKDTPISPRGTSTSR
jgi:hypothetical protein